MSYKTIYSTIDGEIKLCKKLGDAQVASILAGDPTLAVLNRAVDGIGVNRINPVTLAVERKPVFTPAISDLIRQRRVFLLNGSDWTQMPDSPLSESKRAEWAAYRQALRDLPDDQGSVNSFDEVVWPTPPQ